MSPARSPEGACTAAPEGEGTPEISAAVAEATGAPVAPGAADRLARVGPGFADAPHQAQQVFRTVLAALSRPGQVQRLPAAALTGLHSPGLDPAMTATLLALLDDQASLHVAPALQALAPWLQDTLRFHTGARFAVDASEADFIALVAAEADAAWWSRGCLGTDEAPQTGATLLVAVADLGDGPGGALRLRGPGVRDVQGLTATGVPAAFWRARRAQQALFPRGLDLILACGDRLAAVPRSTRLEGVD